jgi:tetratricopeptide (TPR) repeat protein
MITSLEAAANPPRPASPWRVADAAPPEGPAPLGEPQRQWLATHPSVPAKPAPESPVVHLAQASAGEAIPPVTPGETGEQLAQRGGVTSTLNLAVTPSPALPGEVPESAESRAIPLRPASRAGASLPDVAAFFTRLDNPDAAPPRLLPPVVVAQAGPGVEPPAPRVSSHHYLSHPESSPAAPALIAANGLLLEGNHSGALRATLAVMDAYTHTAPVIDAQTQFDDILNDLIEREEAGDSAPFAAVEAGLPGENGALLAAFASVESRYALIAFFQSRMLRALETDNAESAAAYAARTMDLADRTLRENPAHPLQNDVLHYYYDTAVFLGGETYGRCPDYLIGQIRDNGPGIIRWTARLLLADYYARQVDEPVERTLQYASMIEELEASGVPEALADPAAYSWLRAAIEGSIGQAYYALGDFERASVHFNNTFGYRSGSEPKAMAMYFLADIEARKHPHDPGPAIDRYAAMIERYPEDHHADAALLAMAALYHAYGDYAGAIQLYEGVLSRYPDTRSAPAAADAIAYIYANQWGIVEVATAPGEPETPDGALAMHCGPLALQGLLALNGIASGVEELAGLAGTDATGTAMMGLVRASEAKGLPLAGVRSTEPGALKAPCIALLDGNHFVLVSAVEVASIRVRDGAQPEIAMPLADFQARWGGEVLVPAEAEPLAQRPLQRADG